MRLETITAPRIFEVLIYSCAYVRQLHRRVADISVQLESILAINQI